MLGSGDRGSDGRGENGDENSGGDEGGAGVIDARFRIRLPPDTWVDEVSRAAPDATFRLLSGIRTGDSAVELGEVEAADPLAVGESVAAHPSVTDYECLEATDERSLARYETTDTALYEFLEDSALPPEFPLVVRDGWYEFDLTGTRAEFDRLREALEANGTDFELLSVTTRTDADGLVTDRQRELLDAALREGYFAVPRSCTLAELAADVGVDKSTASRVLRRGQAAVVSSYLTAPETGRGESRNR